MDGHATTAERCMLVVLFVCLGCYVHALPRLTLPNNGRNLPDSNAQVHYNITNAEVEISPTIDEVAYIDFDVPSSTFPRPNFCNDCVCGLGRKMRIVGGNVTTVHEYPWIVSMTKRGTFYCAGSVISRRHVLTAAHCLHGFDIKTIKLILADSKHTATGSDAIVRRIKSARMHENFHPRNYNNDIAIIEMDQPISMDGIVRTACLPEDKAIDYTGSIAIAVGWGRTGETKPITDELRKVNLPILSQEECDQAGYAENRIVHDNMLCAGYLNGQRDACFGDSGGPLHVRRSYGYLEVIGIISWGRGCARPQFPGIYTKLSNYIEWIKNHIDGECVCPPPHSQ